MELTVFFLYLFLNFSIILDVYGNNEFDYLRLLDDMVQYRISFKPADQFGTNAQPPAEEKIFKITSADQEQFQCILPNVITFSKKQIESYSGPTPADLLQPIYEGNLCSYRIETYWTYELCHGRYLLQYHEEKETKLRTDYYLGNYARTPFDKEPRHYDQLNPPTRKVGEEMRPYYPVTYTHGTVCDITGKPRQTAVHYVCDQDSKQSIYSVNEVSSCQYEVVVLTSELCAHPSFQVVPNKEHEISCFPVDQPADASYKPKALEAIEEEVEHQYMHEYGLFKSNSVAQSAKQLFGKLLHVEEGVIEDGFSQLNAILDAIKKSSQEQVPQQQSQHPVPPADGQRQQPLTEVQKIVNGFWQGNVCLHGGSGWWKYEVCYGKTITQYHEEADKPRQSIVLGVFDEQVHKAWAKQQPEKVVERKMGGQVMQVTNLYTKGDICQETGAHRSTEMRIRCRDDMTAQKVFIYMLEPETCQYTVVLESPLFCSTLQHVDENGLFPVGALANIGTHMASGQQQTKGQGKNDAVMGSNQKLKTKIKIDIFNQDELLQLVQNLMDGDGAHVVMRTKILKSKDKLTEGEDKPNSLESDSENEEEKNVEGENAVEEMKEEGQQADVKGEDPSHAPHREGEPTETPPSHQQEDVEGGSGKEKKQSHEQRINGEL